MQLESMVGHCSVVVNSTSDAQSLQDSLPPSITGGGDIYTSKPGFSWYKAVLPASAALLALPLLLVSTLLAVVMASVWLASGAHCIAYVMLRRHGKLHALTQEHDCRGPVPR